MTALLKEVGGRFAPLRQKLMRLGVDRESDLNVIMSRFRLGRRLDRGEDILPAGSSPKHSTVLIEGIACLYARLSDGGRQIFAFQYPGDFCDLSRHMLKPAATEAAVAAVTPCSIGVIENAVLEQLLTQYPTLGMALWRSTCLEAGALQAKLLSGRQTALQRVAHLLCELFTQQVSAGIEDRVIPVSQIDLADATGLSVVHVNRTIKVLQVLGVLSKAGRSMKVVDLDRLAGLTAFEASYLRIPPPQPLFRWHVEI
jgi:CRP-like cAMP-binding protein